MQVFRGEAYRGSGWKNTFWKELDQNAAKQWEKMGSNGRHEEN